MNKFLSKLRGFSFFDTFRHASIYFSGTLLIQGLGIISLPIFTHFLDTDQYGIANVYLSYVTVAAVLLSFNLHWAVTRFYLEPDADIKGFMASSVTASSLCFVVFALPILYFKAPIAQFIKLPEATIPLLLLFTYTTIVWSIYSQLRIAQNKSKELTLVQVILQYAKFGFGVLGLWYLGKGAADIFMGKIVGELIAATFVSLWLLYSLWPYMDFSKMRKSHLSYTIQYSIPLIPYALGGYILTSFDQWFINAYCGHSDAGLYSFAYKLGMLLLGLITALQNASIVAYTKWMDEKNYAAVDAQVLSVHKLSILGALFLILFSVDAGTILSGDASFRASLNLVPVIAGGYVFYGIALLYSRVFNYLKINIYLTFVILTAGVINILLNLYFIPIYKYPAAAYTTLASYLIMAILAWFISAKYLKIQTTPISRLLLSLLPLIFITVVYYSLGWQNIGMHWGIIALKLLIAGLFALGLFHKTIKRILGFK